MFEVVSDEILPIDKKEEGRRARFNLHQVPHLEHTALCRRHPLHFLKGVHPFV